MKIKDMNDDEIRAMIEQIVKEQLAEVKGEMKPEKPTGLVEAVEGLITDWDDNDGRFIFERIGIVKESLAREKRIAEKRELIVEAFRAFAPMSGSEYHLRILKQYDEECEK